MTIKSIEISNYQSHKSTTLELSNGVNIIIGNSDSGKSGLIRTLRWLITNKPRGDAFRSHWGGDTEVNLTLNNQWEITRLKSKKDNSYKLYTIIYDENEGREDFQEYDSFNQDVPDEIKSNLNFSDINFQYQIDPPFLLSESSGEVARILNKIVNLDSIDNLLKTIESKKRKFKSEIEHLTIRQTTLENELNQFPNLEEMEKDIVELEVLQKEIDNITNQITVLLTIIKSIESVETELENIGDVDSIEKGIINLIEQSKEIENLNLNYSQLNSIITNINFCKEKLDKLKNIEQAQDTIEELIAIYQKTSNLEDDYFELKNKISDIIEHTTDLENINNEIIELEKQFDTLIPEVCPLCQNQIVKKKLNSAQSVV
jgi:exonuclease SbcC